MPPRPASILGITGQVWAVPPIALALLLLLAAPVLLTVPQREVERMGRDQAERIAAEVAFRAELLLNASASFAGRLEGSLPRRVGEMLAQANRRPGAGAEPTILLSARDPTGQWLGPARTVAPGADAAPTFLSGPEGLQLVTGQQRGPGGAWTIAAVQPWSGLLRNMPQGAQAGLVQEGEFLSPAGLRRLARAPSAGRGEGPLSGADAFVAVMPVPGTSAVAVAEVPAGAFLAHWEASGRAVLFGALALACLLHLLWLGLGALLDRREAAALRRTERAAAEQERRALQEVSRFFAGLPAAVWRGELFADGTVLVGFMSDGVERLTGLQVGQASEPGRWRSQLDSDGLAAVEDFHRRLLREGEAMAEYSFLREDGKRVWLREHARITGMGPNEGAEIAGVISDITSERRLGESAVMSSKLATLGKMAASIAHELSQPLGAITLASETALATLPEQTGNAAARARVTRINQQAERARALIEHLRAFGRADSGEIEPVSLKAAMDGSMLLVGPLLQTAGIDLSVNVPENLPPLRARPVLLEQVLVNLLVNARDALARQPDGERQLSIRAGMAAGGTSVTLVIEDNGPGFPEGVIDHVFEPFFTTKPVGQGTGLGLSICQSIVTAFGGHIAARNTGGGAEFTLTLRIWQPEAANEENTPDRVESA